MSASEAALAQPVPALAPLAKTTAASTQTDELVELNRSGLTGKRVGVTLRAQGGVVGRSLRYKQDVYDRLRSLQTNAYLLRLDGSVFPSFDLGALSGRLGFVGGFETAFAGSARDMNFSADYPVSHSEVFGGVRGRYPIRQSLLGFELTVDRLHAGLDDAHGASGTPDVSYTDIRSAVDFSIARERLRTTLAAGFRVPIGYGEMGTREWFPRIGGYAVEGSIAASYLVARGVALEVSTSLRRFILEMDSQPEDSHEGVSEVAGGAVDSYVAAYFGVNVAL